MTYAGILSGSFLLYSVMCILNVMGKRTCLTMRLSYLLLSTGVFCGVLEQLLQIHGVTSYKAFATLGEWAAFLTPLGATGIIIFDRRRATTTCCLHHLRK